MALHVVFIGEEATLSDLWLSLNLAARSSLPRHPFVINSEQHSARFTHFRSILSGRENRAGVFAFCVQPLKGDLGQPHRSCGRESAGFSSIFLKNAELKPHHSLLDVGCGCLRDGIHFIGYLKRGNYVGIDINQSLLDAGYEIELARAGL
jgi:hypothetical protein